MPLRKGVGHTGEQLFIPRCHMGWGHPPHTPYSLCSAWDAHSQLSHWGQWWQEIQAVVLCLRRRRLTAMPLGWWWLEIQAVALCLLRRPLTATPLGQWWWKALSHSRTDSGWLGAIQAKNKSPQVLPAFPSLYVDLLALRPWVEAWWLACCSTCASDASSSVVNVAGSCWRKSPQFLFSHCDCCSEQVWYVPRCRSCTGTAWGWKLLSVAFDWGLCKRSMAAAHWVQDFGSGLGQCWGGGVPDPV